MWAKVRGYSWWPAKIRELVLEMKKNDRERPFWVDFIGDNTYQILQESKINEFISNFQLHSNTKKKTLLYSIELAKKQLKK